MKHKSLVCWLGLLVGPVGAARFYMYGWRDSIGWSLLLLTLLGAYGFERAQSFGLDDPLSWWFAPLLGVSVAVSAMHTLYWGLMSQTDWNQRYNPDADLESSSGRTNWRQTPTAAALGWLPLRPGWAPFPDTQFA